MSENPRGEEHAGTKTKSYWEYPPYPRQPPESAKQAYQPQYLEQPQNSQWSEYDPSERNEGLKYSRVSMTFGIISATVSLILGIIPLVGVVGIGLGIFALVSARNADRANVPSVVGKSFGLAGIVIGAIWSVLYIVLLVLWVNS